MNIPYSVNMKLKTIPEGVLAQPYDATVDYVIAKNNLDRVQLNLVLAKYNYILRTKLLDFYQNRALW